MACKGNWVCFSCRTGTRRNTWRRVTYDRPETIGMKGNVKCQNCGELVYFIGPSIKVPPKRKIKAWKDLHKSIFSIRQEYQIQLAKQSVRVRHRLEKEMANLKAKPENKERARLIKEYSNELRENT